MIRSKQILHILSVLVGIVAFFMLIPFVMAIADNETAAANGFLWTLIPALISALLVFFGTRSSSRAQMHPRSGFLLVALSWVVVSAISALPFFLSGAIPSYTDAFFETISGYTTTGASILTDIEAMQPALLFWRSLTHWLGGMGIVVLTVAILPLLGIGGVQLIRAESPGPTFDKITPRVARTAKILWLIYVGLTAAETLLLMAGGMTLFDALTHTFGTMATGGFSPKAASVGHYNSAYIDWVITVFMVAAGLNFTLYYRMLRRRLRDVWYNSEMWWYLGIFAGATLIIAFVLRQGTYQTDSDSLRYAAFQTATILTTTGYATANFDTWPTLAKGVLFLLMFVGGCAGSTGGGIKVIRVLTIIKQSVIEMKYLFRPRAIFRLKINRTTVRKDFIFTVFGFVVLYFCCLLVVTLVVMSGGYGLETSFSGALATVGNIGPGFAKLGPAMNYAFLPDYIKWVLSLAMLIGRLEVYTVLVLLLPSFWRR